MATKKEILYKVLGVTGIIGIPTAATLGVVLGTKETNYKFVQKPAVTVGEKYFDKVIHTADGVDDSYAMSHILAPNKGHNLLGRYVNLSRNYDLQHINNLIAVDTKTGNRTPALLYLNIKMSDILSITQLNREFERINNILFEEGQKTDDSLGVYAQVDVPTRSIFVVAYKLKPLDDSIGTIVNGQKMTKQQLVKEFISALPTQEKIEENMRSHDYSFDKRFRQIVLSQAVVNPATLAWMGIFDNPNGWFSSSINDAKEAFKNIHFTWSKFNLNKRIETKNHESHIYLDRDEETSGDLRDFYRYRDENNDGSLVSFPFVVRTASSEPNWDSDLEGFKELFQAGIYPTVTPVIDWRENLLIYKFTFYDASDGKAVVISTSLEDTVRNPAGVSTYRISIPLDVFAPKNNKDFSLESMKEFVKNNTSVFDKGISSNKEAGHGYMSPETKAAVDKSINDLNTKADFGRFILKSFCNLDKNNLNSPFAHYINRDLIGDGLKLIGKFLPGLKAPIDNFIDLIRKLKDSSSLKNPTQSSDLKGILASDAFAEKIVDWLNPIIALEEGNRLDGENNQFNFNPYPFVYRFCAQFAYEEPRIKTGHEVNSATNADGQKWLTKSDGTPANNGDFSWASIPELTTISSTEYDGRYNLYDLYTLVASFSHLSVRVFDYLEDKEKNQVADIKFKEDLNIDTTGTITELINWAKSNNLIPIEAGINDIIADPFKYLPHLIKGIARGVPIPRDILEKGLPILPIPGLSAADMKILVEELSDLLSDKDTVIALFDILRGKHSIDELVDMIIDKHGLLIMDENGLNLDVILNLIKSILDRKADPQIPGDHDATFIDPSLLARLMNILTKINIIPPQFRSLLTAQNIGLLLDMINDGTASEVLKFGIEVMNVGLHEELSDEHIAEFTDELEELLVRIGRNKVYPINEETAQILSHAIVNLLRHGISSETDENSLSKIILAIGNILKIPSDIVDIKPIADMLSLIINGNPDHPSGLSSIIEDEDSFKTLINVLYKNDFISSFIIRFLPSSILKYINMFNTPAAQTELHNAIHGLLYGFNTEDDYNAFLKLVDALIPNINLFDIDIPQLGLIGTTFRELLSNIYKGNALGVFNAGHEISRKISDFLHHGILGYSSGTEFKEALHQILTTPISAANLQLMSLLPGDISGIINKIMDKADKIWEAINSLLTKPLSQIDKTDVENIIATFKIFVPTITLPQKASEGIMQLKESGLFTENYFGETDSVDLIIQMIKVFSPELPAGIESILRDIIWGRNNIGGLAGKVADDIVAKIESIFGEKPTVELLSVIQGAETSSHRNGVIRDMESSLKDLAGMSRDEIIAKYTKSGLVDFDGLSELRSKIDKLIADIKVTNEEQEKFNAYYSEIKAILDDRQIAIDKYSPHTELLPAADDPTAEENAYSEALENLRQAGITNIKEMFEAFKVAAAAYENAIKRENYLATHRIKNIWGNSEFKIFNIQWAETLVKRYLEGVSLQHLLRGDESKDISDENHGWQVAADLVKHWNKPDNYYLFFLPSGVSKHYPNDPDVEAANRGGYINIEGWGPEVEKLVKKVAESASSRIGNRVNSYVTFIIGDSWTKVGATSTGVKSVSDVENIFEVQFLKALATYDFKWLEDHHLVEEIPTGELKAVNDLHQKIRDAKNAAFASISNKLTDGATEPTTEKEAYESALVRIRSASSATIDDLVQNLKSTASTYNDAIKAANDLFAKITSAKDEAEKLITNTLKSNALEPAEKEAYERAIKALEGATSDNIDSLVTALKAAATAYNDAIEAANDPATINLFSGKIRTAKQEAQALIVNELISSANEPTEAKQAYEDAINALNKAQVATIDDLIAKLKDAASAYNQAIYIENYLATHVITGVLGNDEFTIFSTMQDFVRDHFEGKSLRFILSGSSQGHGWRVGILGDAHQGYTTSTGGQADYYAKFILVFLPSDVSSSGPNVDEYIDIDGWGQEILDMIAKVGGHDDTHGRSLNYHPEQMETRYVGFVKSDGHTEQEVHSADEINRLLEVQLLKAIAEHDFDWLSDHGFID